MADDIVIEIIETGEESGVPGASSLSELTDVQITSPSNGQALLFDSVSGKWVNGTGGGVGAVSSVNGQTGVVVLVKGNIGLGNVDNTTDANKPVSTPQAAAISVVQEMIPTNNTQLANGSNYVNASQAASASPVQSVAGRTGAVTVTKTDVGLSVVDNTTDANKPVSTAQGAAIAAVQASIPTNNNELTNGAGFVTAATAPVRTVNGVSPTSGDVVLVKGNIGLGNVDNTSDLSKPVSTAQQTAIDAKQNNIVATTAGDYYRGDKVFAALNKTAVGLSNVDNTADTAKPVSTIQAAAIAVKLTIPTGSATADYLNGVGAPVARPRYEVLSALPGDLSGYPDGSRIVIT